VTSIVFFGGSTRAGIVSDNTFGTIKFLMKLKRQLWSSYVHSLGRDNGLLEHDLLAIMSSACRLLYMQGANQPTIPWTQLADRMWLDSLLLCSLEVWGGTAMPSAKKNSFKNAINSQYTTTEKRRELKQAQAVVIGRFFRRHQ
jgi:hypothetical protein